MDPETKKLLDDLNRTFSEFREKNDERIKQIEAKGSADAALTSAVDKLNARIGEIEETLREVSQRQARTAAMRAGQTDTQQIDERVSARVFHAIVNRVKLRTVTDSMVDLEQFRAYRQAFRDFVHRGVIMDTLQVGSDPDGGYLVPPDMTGEIIRLQHETSPMRQLATVQSTTSDRKGGLLDLERGTSGGWVTELQERPKTGTPKRGRWIIDVHEQYAMPAATQQDLDDEPDGAAWLAGKTAEELTIVENTAFFTGNGVGKPRGILTYAAGTPTAANWQQIRQISTGVNGGFHADTPGDVFIDAIHALKEQYLPNARWVMNRLTAAAVRKFKDADKNYLWQPGLQAGEPGLLLGFPITRAEDMPALAINSLSIGFGDFRAAYTIIDRMGMRVVRDDLTDKPNVLFYTTKRVGGGVKNFEAVVLLKAAA